MAIILPGDILTVKVGEEEYKTTVKEEVGGKLVASYLSHELNKVIKNNEDMPLPATISVEFGNGMNFIPEMPTPVVDDKGNRWEEKGFELGVYGELSDNLLEVLGIYNLDAQIKELKFIRETTSFGKIKYSGYLTTTLQAMEAVKRDMVIRLDAFDIKGKMKESIIHGAVGFDFDETLAEEIFNYLHQGTPVQASFNLLGATVYTADDLIYYIEPGTGIQVTAFGKAGIEKIEVTSSSVTFRMQKDAAQGGDTLKFNYLSQIGTTYKLEDASVLLTENKDREVYGVVTDEEVVKVFNEAGAYAIRAVIKNIPLDYELGEFTMTPILDDNQLPTWLSTDNPDEVNVITNLVDKFQPWQEDSDHGSPIFEELATDANQSYIYLTDTSIEQLGRQYALIVSQLNAEGNALTKVSYTAIVERHNGRPCLVISNIVPEGAMHSFASWGQYCFVYDQPITFDLKTQGPTTEYIGNYLVRMDKVGETFVAGDGKGHSVWENYPEKQPVEPIKGISVASADNPITRALFYVEGAKRNDHVSFRHGDSVMVGRLGALADVSPYFTLTSNDKDLSFFLRHTVNNGPQSLLVEHHSISNNYNLYGAKSGDLVGYQAGVDHFGVLIDSVIENMHIMSITTEQAIFPTATIKFANDVNGHRAIGRIITWEDRSGNTAKVIIREDEDGTPVGTITEQAIVGQILNSDTQPYGFNMTMSESAEMLEIFSMLDEYIRAVRAGEAEGSDTNWAAVQTILLKYHLRVMLLKREDFFTAMEYTHLRVSMCPDVFDQKLLFKAFKELNVPSRVVTQFNNWIQVIMTGHNKIERSAKVAKLNKDGIVNNFISPDDKMQIAAWLDYITL